MDYVFASFPAGFVRARSRNSLIKHSMCILTGRCRTSDSSSSCFVYGCLVEVLVRDPCTRITCKSCKDVLWKLFYCVLMCLDVTCKTFNIRGFDVFDPYFALI